MHCEGKVEVVIGDRFPPPPTPFSNRRGGWRLRNQEPESKHLYFVFYITQINLYSIFEGMTENKCNLSVRSHKVDTALNNADTSCTANNISIPWRRASSLYASRD